MASLTIRNLDNATKARLRLQAARTILRQAVAASPDVPAGPGLGSRIQAHFASCGGVELDLPARVSMAQAARFAEEQA
ncbi:plasmid stabilization protein [Synechococcus sp. CS-1324]|uniref:FitA-like ribbon-helix-helix domain-containing protein n=1 Tax=Synechococcus sp. CS-1324 TaxID=2847980 RepID=UPI000DB8E9DF|nr:plasmid stabilization protein [Synechococcus sp. CS-1324]MCT0229921.1 plasmid stabilization protein [Synechococcus sp. CS-1324]PZV02441.1 MAG: plasmid stabilization protein [Cyanobium sp.]